MIHPLRHPLLFARQVVYELRRRARGGEPRRYRHLGETIDRLRARRLLEIGTWNGAHARQMIAAAARHHPVEEVEYYGFDLFEDLDAEKLVAEISKQPPARSRVQRELEATGARVELAQGDTVETLPAAVARLPEMDFIYIDGGHSYETVASDWRACRELMHAGTEVIFDDYWHRPDAGTDRVVAEIDRDRYEVEILDPRDSFVKEWGVLHIRFVRVRRRDGGR